jgi:Glycosyl hydrolase family 12/Cellulose binding domain
MSLEPSAPASRRERGGRRRPRAVRGRTFVALSGALATVLCAVGVGIGVESANAATTICEKYGSTTVGGGKYVVINNNWGDDTQQCINVTDNGFQVTTASHNKPQNGAPGAYPAIYAGCHYTNCSAGSGLPMAVTNSAFNSVATSVSMTYPGSGVYDAAYDIWFDPTPRTDGQNTGAELMVWLNHTGSVQPVGSKVGTVNIAGGTWDVWYGNSGWNVVSYVRQQPTSSISFNVSSFFNDMLSRGYAQRSWYLTSVQAGFEPWVGGTGLAVNSFSYTTNGTQPPPSTTTPPPGPSTPVTTPPPGGGGCSATYSVTNAWSGGYQAAITVKASGAIKGWRLSFPLNGSTINSLWGGRGSVSGSSEVVTNETWNGSLGAGQTTTVGFVANGTSSNPSITCSAT